MSVSPRPTDEATGVDTSQDAERSAADRASQLEETREGGFSEHPATPVSLTMPYNAGDVIANKYRLTKVLGEGGMGAVWLARNLALEIDVAIKLIRHDYANAEGAVRLLQEARAAARIGHPCIVRVFDFGTTERADPFIVMEVLQGESLAETIKRKGKLSAISAIRTLLPVAGALSAAHSKGIVHRDLKPDNIRLVTDDRGAVIPKVVDFGIAKLHADDSPKETTQAGVILGSPHYMSPEQACGRSDVDHRTDIWAFSVMIYEVITGKRPFEGPNYNALISSILVFHPAHWEEHDIQEPALWGLVQKGLAKEQTDRWQTMQEYGEALAIWASQRDVETDAAGNSLRAHWLAATVQRPLSEFPPANGSGDIVRPRMISVPSIPELAELLETNENLTTEKSLDAEPVPSAVAPPAPPSSLPLATTASKPPERRLPAMWIGPLALAIGAIVAAVVMIATKEDPRGTDQRPAAAPSSAIENTNKPAARVDQAASSSPVGSASAEQGPVVPAAGAVSSTAAPPSSAIAPPSAQASASTAPVRSNASVSNVKPSKKPPTTPPPIPTDPNF